MAGWGWRTDLVNNCVCFHGVVIDSLLTANLGTLFVKRRTGFLTYADDPKVSVIIRDGAVNLLFAGIRKFDKGPLLRCSNNDSVLTLYYNAFPVGQ